MTLNTFIFTFCVLITGNTKNTETKWYCIISLKHDTLYKGGSSTNILGQQGRGASRVGTFQWATFSS